MNQAQQVSFYDDDLKCLESLYLKISMTFSILTADFVLGLDFPNIFQVIFKAPKLYFTCLKLKLIRYNIQSIETKIFSKNLKFEKTKKLNF